MAAQYSFMKFIFIFFILSFNILFGFDSIKVLNPNITVHKSGYFQTQKELSPQEVLLQSFIPLPKEAKSFGIHKDTFWFYFEISTTSNEMFYLDSKDYFPDANYELFTLQNNSFVTIKNHDIKSQQKQFALLQNSDKTIYLLRAKSMYAILPTFTLGNQIEVAQSWEIIHSIMLISYFIGLAFLIYNLFLYLFTKEKSFIYYCIYIFGLLLLSIAGRSYLPFGLVLDPSTPKTLIVISLMLVVFGLPLFTIALLNLKKTNPKLTKIFITLSILTAIFTPFYYSNIVEVRFIYLLMVVSMACLIFYIGFIVLWVHKSKIGLYYLASTGIGLSFIVVYLSIYIPHIDLFPLNPWSMTLVNFALIWDVITLSLVLAYRIKLLQEENIKNERLAIIKSKETTIGELSGNIAHQWRTPLAELGAIQANTEARLRFSMISKEELLEQLSLAKDVVQHLSSTVNTFQSFFQNTPQNEHFCLNDEIKRTIAFVQQSLKNNNIDITFIEKIDNATLKGNSNEFLQIILNIILNAKDALIANNQEKKMITIELLQYMEGFKITIRDNGGGIKIKPIESIFESYVTNKHHGNGIGLFIVKTIVEQKFDGKISAYNEKDGAIFELKLTKSL